jgi:hypothetical protein
MSELAVRAKALLERVARCLGEFLRGFTGVSPAPRAPAAARDEIVARSERRGNCC